MFLNGFIISVLLLRDINNLAHTSHWLWWTKLKKVHKACKEFVLLEQFSHTLMKCCCNYHSRKHRRRICCLASFNLCKSHFKCTQHFEKCSDPQPWRAMSLNLWLHYRHEVSVLLKPNSHILHLMWINCSPNLCQTVNIQLYLSSCN